MFFVLTYIMVIQRKEQAGGAAQRPLHQGAGRSKYRRVSQEDLKLESFAMTTMRTLSPFRQSQQMVMWEECGIMSPPLTELKSEFSLPAHEQLGL